MDEHAYRPRLGRTYDECKCTDTWGDALLDSPGESHVPPVVVPQPCSLSTFCSRPNFHLGPCDNAERLELVTVWDCTTGELYYDPDTDLPPERPFWKRSGT